MSNFTVLWIQSIHELCYFNYLNSKIMSYLFFKSWIYHDNLCRQLLWQYCMSNFMILWIQSIHELCHFNHWNSSIMSYLFFKSWTYSSTYLTCLSNHNFTMTRCVIHVTFSLKSLKIIWCSSFCVHKCCFCMYFVSIVFIDLHSLSIRAHVLTHFSQNHISSVKLRDVWLL